MKTKVAAAAVSAMEAEILAALKKAAKDGEKPVRGQREGEKRKVYLARLTEAANALPEPAYLKLSDEARKWVDINIENGNDDKPLVDFPADGAEEDDDADEKPAKKGKAKAAAADKEDDDADEDDDEEEGDADEDDADDEEDDAEDDDDDAGEDDSDEDSDGDDDADDEDDEGDEDDSDEEDDDSDSDEDGEEDDADDEDGDDDAEDDDEEEKPKPKVKATPAKAPGNPEKVKAARKALRRIVCLSPEIPLEKATARLEKAGHKLDPAIVKQTWAETASTIIMLKAEGLYKAPKK